ncbi:hypothetical protein [Allosphingosinicella sp.]|uniref:hypothetical protein n=1 Tax=Allosphingosinicella sp. TaxID=2823234 RepID=UPI002FC0E8DD
MTRLVRTSKVTTVEYDLEDVRALLAGNAEEALGAPEDGFDRQIQMKTVFHVERGDVIVTGFQLTVQDSAKETAAQRKESDAPALFSHQNRS